MLNRGILAPDDKEDAEGTSIVTFMASAHVGLCWKFSGLAHMCTLGALISPLQARSVEDEKGCDETVCAEDGPIGLRGLLQDGRKNVSEPSEYRYSYFTLLLRFKYG